MNPKKLLKHFNQISEAPDAVPQLRRFILDLGVQGKLFEQDSNNEPASEILKRIREQKEQLLQEGEIGKYEWKDIDSHKNLYFSTPHSWSLTCLRNVALRIHYGFTASANYSIRNVRFLRISDIQNNSVDWSSVPGCEISQKEIYQYKIEPGDILIARTGGTIGKSYLVTDVPVTSVFASYLIRVQIPSLVYGRYLKLFLESSFYWKQIAEGSKGAGQPNVNGRTLGELIFPFPPIDEQYRIVEKVDELMALCDDLEKARTKRESRRDRLVLATLNKMTADADDPKPDKKTSFKESARFYFNHLPRLTTRPEHIQSLRQTILDLAVRGKLVDEESAEDSSGLIERIEAIRLERSRYGKVSRFETLEEVERNEFPFKLPKGWGMKRMGWLAEKLGAGSTPRGGKAVYQEEGIPFLRSQNVYNDGVRLDNVAFIPPIIHERMLGTNIQQDDILLNITGASIGRCALVPEELSQANVSQHVAIIRLFDPRIREFIHLCLISPIYQNMIMDVQVGVSREGLSMQRLKKFPIPLPPLSEQRRIIKKVKDLMVICSDLEDEIDKSISIRSNLLESVLIEVLKSKARDSSSENIAPFPKQERAKDILSGKASERHAGHDMYNKAALVAYIVNRCYHLDYPMGRVKLAKLFYLVQKKSELALTEEFVKQVAGPLDKELPKVLSLAVNHQWLVLARSQGRHKPVHPGPKNQEAVAHAEKKLTISKAAVDAMLDTMKAWGWKTLERWATVLEVSYELMDKNEAITLSTVKQAIAKYPEWRQKLEQEEFSDTRLASTIKGLRENHFIPTRVELLS